MDTLFSRLEGRWKIARTIDPEGSLAGMAEFVRRPDGWLHYREAGELVLPHGRFQADRRYRFEPMSDGFAVFFDADPLRLFHRIRLEEIADGRLRGEAEHPCGRDTYLTTYIFHPDGEFSVRHRVSGPNKDYTVQTLYKRANNPSKEIAA